ncbi:MAG: helix-turn-helix domain-containing protein [Micrococcales bacterium]|nr:helix-turn-helix domain-containing protein [Micrococcales bacterium]
MEITVPEAADVLGLSARRVRQLIGAGRLRARRVGRQWLVDGASLPTTPRRSRPMSVSVAWAFLMGVEPADPQAARRWRQRRRQLADDPEPESLLASWVASRGERLELAGRELGAVVADPRLAPSGMSDSRAGLSAADLAEGWVSASDLDGFCRDHLLLPATAAPSVVVHVEPVTVAVSAPVPLLLLAADLADHHQPRPTARARDLISQALA